MGLIKYITALSMIALFSIALISFAVNFASDNDVDISLEDDSLWQNRSDELNISITTFYDDANTSTTAMAESTSDLDTETTEGGTTFKVTIWRPVEMVRKVIVVPFERLFGDEFNLFFTALISILTITGTLYVIKAWFGKNPD